MFSASDVIFSRVCVVFSQLMRDFLVVVFLTSVAALASGGPCRAAHVCQTKNTHETGPKSQCLDSAGSATMLTSNTLCYYPMWVL